MVTPVCKTFDRGRPKKVSNGKVVQRKNWINLKKIKSIKTFEIATIS